MLHACIVTPDTPRGSNSPYVTFGRNTQIAPNSLCTHRAIGLFCSLIFMSSVTEIWLNKLHVIAKVLFKCTCTNRIWSDLSISAKNYGEFEPLGVLEVAILAQSMFKTPKCTSP